jgi:branched-chain amino acid transport system substrate-binding protein
MHGNTTFRRFCQHTNLKRGEKMKNRIRFTIVLVIIFSLIPLCLQAGGTGEETQEGGGVIKVGILGPMTGPQVDIGLTMRDGSILAMEEINKAGGIAGKKFEWIIIDDEATPATSVNGAKKLIFDHNIEILLGPPNSGCALGVGEVTQANGIVNVVPGQNATLTRPEWDYVFRSSVKDVEMAKCKMAFLEGNYKRIAVIHETNGYGEHWYQTMLEMMNERGLKFVADESLETSTFDLTPQATRIAKANPDMELYLGSYGVAVANLIKAEKTLGLKVDRMGPVYAGQSAIELGGSDVEGAMLIDTVDLNKPTWKEYKQKYMKRFGVGEVFTFHSAAQPYDAVYLLAQGLEKTNGEAGEALKNALEEGVSVDGVIGRVGSPGARWSKDRHDALMAEDLVINAIGPGGKFVTIPR